MMLRKRTRSNQKNQHMSHSTISDSDSGSESYLQSDVLGHKHKNNPLFSVPGLFVGLSPKGLSDCDSLRSPTSPLDFKIFSNLGNVSSRSPRSPHNGHPKGWDGSKVGLSIIDSLDGDMKIAGKILPSSESKNILFGPQMRSKTLNCQTHNNSFETPKSLPKDYSIFHHTQNKSPLEKENSDVVFEIGETSLESEPFGKIRSCSLDSCSRSFSILSGLAELNPSLSSGNVYLENIPSKVISPPQLIGGNPNANDFSHSKLNPISVSIGSVNGFIESLSASEIELSEDYTCVISHGPNPKTTHIYGDCILEWHANELSNFGKCEGKEIGLPEAVTSPATQYTSDDFLSVCYSCSKKLEEGKDIYIYRGEKAFCSLICRSQEILIDEEMEKIIDKSSQNSPKSDSESSQNSPKSDSGEELLETGIFVAT